MQFSALIPVYEKEDASFFDQALQSIWDEQTQRPDEMVIVEDGKLTPELDAVVSKWKAKLEDKLKTVPLQNNVGLGTALQRGLEACTHELVARMDSDDIAESGRFEVQISCFISDTDLGLLGSHILEFEHNTQAPEQIKKVPLSHAEIVQYSKFRNPFNHPSVMFKKTLALKAGGYQHQPGMEDYLLWVRMMLAGAQTKNVDQVLVKMRVGSEFLKRRGGGSYAKQELQLQKTLLELKHITTMEFLRNIVLRMPLRIMPVRLRSFFYNQSRVK